ncbi:MAG: hypothetical protein AAFV29_25690, partial [Myxococcota bacterium]
MTRKRLTALWGASIFFIASGCSDWITTTKKAEQSLALDPNDCSPAQNVAAIRSAFRATLFPDSANDVPFLCGLEGSGQCPSPHRHLDGVIAKPPFAVPTRTQCIEQPQRLQACDRHAKHLITSGLENGDLIRILEGSTRLTELMAQPFAPPHYSLGNPQNAFLNWLTAAGVDHGKLGQC